MRAFLGQPFIIENVGGAAGSTGVGRAVRSPGDGYTLSIETTDSHVLTGAPMRFAGEPRLAVAPDIPTVDEAVTSFGGMEHTLLTMRVFARTGSPRATPARRTRCRRADYRLGGPRCPAR